MNNLKLLKKILKKLKGHSLILLPLFASLFLLSSCVTSPKTDTDPNSLQAQNYLNKAKKTSGSTRADWLLLAAESLYINHRTDKALNVLDSISTTNLNSDSGQFYHLLMGQSLFSASRHQQALAQFSKINQPDSLKQHQQIAYHRDYGELLSILTHHYDSALQRIQLAELLIDQLEIDENTELLWIALMQVENLQVYQNSLNSYTINGWLELADLAKTYANQPDTLLEKLEFWHNRFNDHPANKQLPIDMARAEAARSYQPDQIAVLLAENGRMASSAKQVRDGFLTAIYQLSKQDRPEIVFYDTSSDVEINELYQQAIDEGASFVIGPLDKKLVQKLSNQEYYPVPVLAINRLTDEKPMADNFYQFGLPVEDEAIQAASKAWDDGLTRAIVLVPNNGIGNRTSDAFTTQFERLGGSVQQVVNYNSDDDLSRAVQALLGVDKSIERFSQLRQLFRMRAHHEARRRQDADFIFFKASVKQARSIKPFIDYYFAHDLPVYSTSSIYSGKNEPLLDSDLNNILFCDIPWLLSDDFFIQNKKQQVASIWPKATESNSARLFALGHDLFTLIPELSKLKNFPQYRKHGLSGQLSVDEFGHVNRELSWAKFKKGKPVRIKSVSLSLNQSQL